MGTIKIKGTDGNWVKLPNYGVQEFPEAPVDNKTYGRKNRTWTEIQVDFSGIEAELANKVDKVTGKGLSTNDYTTEDKTKVTNTPTITMSTNIPTASDGNNGDIWIQYDNGNQGGGIVTPN